MSRGVNMFRQRVHAIVCHLFPLRVIGRPHEPTATLTALGFGTSLPKSCAQIFLSPEMMGLDPEVLWLKNVPFLAGIRWDVFILGRWLLSPSRVEVGFRHPFLSIFYILTTWVVYLELERTDG